MPKRSELKLTKRAVDALSVDAGDALFCDREQAGSATHPAWPTRRSVSSPKSSRWPRRGSRPRPPPAPETIVTSSRPLRSQLGEATFNVLAFPLDSVAGGRSKKPGALSAGWVMATLTMTMGPSFPLHACLGPTWPERIGSESRTAVIATRPDRGYRVGVSRATNGDNSSAGSNTLP